MRTRNWVAAVAVIAVGSILPGRLAAQPKSTEPTIEFRLRSVNDLLDKAEYVGGLIDKDEPIKQARALLKGLSTDGKGVMGLDTKRPIGAYAILNAEVASSPVVVMVPVADEKLLFQSLKERVGIEPEKVEGGAYKLNVPLINELYIRFADGYLYAARDLKHLDPKGLISPKTFFAQDDGSVISVVARFDRIPNDLKTFVIGQLEHQIQEQLRKDAKIKPVVEMKLETIFADGIVGGVKSLVEEGKELRIRALADPKADELSIDVSVTAREGTDLAKRLAGLKGKTSGPAGIVASAGPVVGAGAKISLTEDQKKQLDPLIDAMIAGAVKQAKPEERELARRVFETIAPTLKAGELDIAATVVGPNAKGKHALLAALVVKDGKAIEKLLKEFAPLIPAGAVELTFDVDTIGAYTLHKVVLAQTDAAFDRVFGTKTLWLAISKDAVAFSVEPDGELLRAGLKAKPAATGVVTGSVALSKAVPAFDTTLKPDEVKALLKDAFGNTEPAGKDAITISVEGGSQLSIRVVIKGKAFRLAALIAQFKGN